MENLYPRPRRHSPISFMRGRRLYQIAPAREGQGYVGLRDGRIVTTGDKKADVAKTWIGAVG
jgi:hypothetical protein